MANDYSLAHKERQKSGQAKPKANDQNKSFMTIEPDPSAKTPFILDEGGVPRYQLPTEKTRQQTISETEKT